MICLPTVINEYCHNLFISVTASYGGCRPQPLSSAERNLAFWLHVRQTFRDGDKIRSPDLTGSRNANHMAAGLAAFSALEPGRAEQATSFRRAEGTQRRAAQLSSAQHANPKCHTATSAGEQASSQFAVNVPECLRFNCSSTGSE